MGSNQRMILALGIVLLDLLMFALPLAAVFAGYILISRPPWFRVWIERLYEN